MRVATHFCIFALVMATKLLSRLKQTKPMSPQTEALLSVLVAADYFRQTGGNLCAEELINFTQYNILRILKGVYPEGHPRFEIRQRLIEQGSDITRHIDKLVSAGLAERVICDNDKRWSVTKITMQGLNLLDRLTPKLEIIEASLTSKLNTQECNQLSEICERIYQSS